MGGNLPQGGTKETPPEGSLVGGDALVIFKEVLLASHSPLLDLVSSVLKNSLLALSERVCGY